MRLLRGYTLVELMVVLSVVAIGVTLAVPALGGLLRDTRRGATLAVLAHALHAARTAAATSGRAVRLCATRDGSSCSGELRWDPQLLQRPAAGPAGAGEPLLRVVPLPGGSLTRVFANRAFIEFAPLAPAATTTTLTVCDDRGAAAARALIVSRTGRVRASDRNASGGPLACPATGPG